MRRLIATAKCNSINYPLLFIPHMLEGTVVRDTKYLMPLVTVRTASLEHSQQ